MTDQTPATVVPLAPARKGYILSPGDVLGHYRVEKGIGSGGMGEVYLAVNINLNIRRAVKILKPEIAAANPVFAERFIQEARLATQLQHENTVNVIDVAYSREFNLRYIVMEYVDGGNIRGMLKMFGAINERKALEMILALCGVLKRSEELHMVHRDIKPENIMLTRSGIVKLADFGIAKSLESQESQLTMMNSLVGTPAYIAPEQARDARSVDIRADIYSLGVVLYEMLTGTKCFTGKTSTEILEKVFCEIEHNPREVNKSVSSEAARLVMRMMAREPGGRPANAAELAAAITAILDGFRARRKVLRNVISDRLYARITAIPYTVKRLLVSYFTSRAMLRAVIVVLLALLWMVLSLNGCIRIDYGKWLSSLGWSGPRETYAAEIPLQAKGFVEIRLSAPDHVLSYLKRNGRQLEIRENGRWRILKCPCLYEVPAGKQELRFRLADCRELPPVALDIEEKNTRFLEIAPELLPGRLEISADADGLTVLTPDGWVRSDAAEIPGAAVSDVFLRAPGHAIKRLADIRLEPGEVKTVAVSLDPEYRAEPAVGDVKRGIDAFDAGNYPLAFQLLSAAAPENPEVEFRLGRMYETGRGAMFADMEKAAAHYRKAASRRHPGAMKKMGDLCRGGAVSANNAAAAKWYEAGALLGDPECMRLAGMMHEFGRGVAADPRKAFSYYRMGAEAGDAEAMLALGRICEIGARETPPDSRQALLWYRKGADAGSKEAESRWKQLQNEVRR